MLQSRGLFTYDQYGHTELIGSLWMAVGTSKAAPPYTPIKMAMTPSNGTTRRRENCLAGTRMALYSELSCDESVIQRAHGTELVSALAKLALPERGRPLQAAALSRLSYRLARLAGPAQTTKPTATLLLTSLFAAVIAAGVFQTIAHTACCFVLKR